MNLTIQQPETESFVNHVAIGGILKNSKKKIVRPRRKRQAKSGIAGKMNRDYLPKTTNAYWKVGV